MKLEDAEFAGSVPTALSMLVGPVVGALIALVGVYMNERMRRAAQEQSRHRDEVLNIAAELLTLAEDLWRRGWELWQATSPLRTAVDRGGSQPAAEQELLTRRLEAMHRENEVHFQALSAQRRLMLACPRLDNVTTELIEASRLWPPPIERPGKDAYARRDEAERAFVAAARTELED